MFMSPHTIVASGPGGDHLPQRSQPGELVLVVVGVRARARWARTPTTTRIPPQVADTARASGCGKPGAPANPAHDVLEPDPREDRDAVPRGLAVGGDRVAALGKLVAEQLGERVVGELGLLQADDVRAGARRATAAAAAARCLTELTFQVAIRIHRKVALRRRGSRARRLRR